MVHITALMVSSLTVCLVNYLLLYGTISMLQLWDLPDEDALMSCQLPYITHFSGQGFGGHAACVTVRGDS